MAEFLTDGIVWEDVKFNLVMRQHHSRTATKLQSADLADPVWQARFLTGPMPKLKAEEFHTIMLDLGGAITPFLAHTADRPRPALIPSGGLSGITVSGIGPNFDEISLSGMPIRSTLIIGDYIAILTSTSRELVKVRSNVTANDLGDTPLFRVTPHLAESVLVGNPAQLDKPRMQARLEPGSLDISRVVGFEWYQVSFTALQE